MYTLVTIFFFVKLHMWPSMHKSTIHRKTSKSSFLHRPLTKLFLVTTMFLFFSIQLLVLKLYDCDTVECTYWEMSVSNFIFILRLLNSPRNIRFVFDEYYRVSGPNFARRGIIECIDSIFDKREIDKYRPVCYFDPYWKIAYCGELLVYAWRVTSFYAILSIVFSVIGLLLMQTFMWWQWNFDCWMYQIYHCNSDKEMLL